MRIQRLRSADEPIYAQAMELYQHSFPFYEQREANSQHQILSHRQYHFGLILEDDAFAGLMLYWETETFLYVEHFCMLPERRGQGLGRMALELLGEAGKPIILENDPPVDDIAKRRKGFYQRAGFTANPYPHVHPPYHAGHRGHDLVVMSSPAQLSQEEYDSFALYLSRTVMEQA